MKTIVKIGGVELSEVKNQIKVWFGKKMRWIYNYLVLSTPLDFRWSYKFYRNEISKVILRDEKGTAIATFNAVSRKILLSGDYASASFYAEEGISLLKVQRRMLHFLLHDERSLIRKGFILLNYQRVFDFVEPAKDLTYEYSWHSRDQFLWLLKGETVICEYDGETNRYRFKDGNWKEMFHETEEEFREFIENREKFGFQKA